MILKILQNSKKTINMTHFEESDYGFFCDLEQDNYILEDLGQAITYSVDGEFNELDIDIEDC